ncbi:hypothetical protein MOQ_002381 [Trypanosoma cruzi marinkellei]|uniref:Uncharacterized protein n=1 Tax=Trypanosoma cruzi marinkellei TaxID=85056 RepID=K2N440_TRYCR|nr:hypothetical protein MOQ_002381 [Trypanosoma cruzi marinkellei]
MNGSTPAFGLLLLLFFFSLWTKCVCVSGGMELLAGMNSDIVSCITRILQRHAAQVRALREEEIAINARAEQLERLTELLLRGEIVSSLHESSLDVPQPEEENRWIDEEVLAATSSAPQLVNVDGAVHKTWMEGSPVPASQGSSQNMLSVEPPREAEGEERNSTTPSPMRRELDEFFPIAASKRPRQACVTEGSSRHRSCPEVCKNDVGTEAIITATDILATIPCISSITTPTATTVDAVLLEEKPRSYVRSHRRRQEDYAADTAMYVRGTEGAQVACTPSVYWEIAFPKGLQAHASAYDDQGE